MSGDHSNRTTERAQIDPVAVTPVRRDRCGPDSERNDDEQFLAGILDGSAEPPARSPDDLLLRNGDASGPVAGSTRDGNRRPDHR